MDGARTARFFTSSLPRRAQRAQSALRPALAAQELLAFEAVADVHEKGSAA